MWLLNITAVLSIISIKKTDLKETEAAQPSPTWGSSAMAGSCSEPPPVLQKNEVMGADFFKEHFHRLKSSGWESWCSPGESQGIVLVSSHPGAARRGRAQAEQRSPRARRQHSQAPDSSGLHSVASATIQWPIIIHNVGSSVGQGVVLLVTFACKKGHVANRSSANGGSSPGCSFKWKTKMTISTWENWRARNEAHVNGA